MGVCTAFLNFAHDPVPQLGVEIAPSTRPFSFARRSSLLFTQYPPSVPEITGIVYCISAELGRSIDLSTWSVRPYLGSDDLRDPDSERTNQWVAACAAHAPFDKALVGKALCQRVKSFNKLFFATRSAVEVWRVTFMLLLFWFILGCDAAFLQLHGGTLASLFSSGGPRYGEQQRVSCTGVGLQNAAVTGLGHDNLNTADSRASSREAGLGRARGLLYDGSPSSVADSEECFGSCV
ncbi:hypothetical protein BJV77DRAFT_965901 [Russula vinacea]|nr:hypothetical protein BJV77DRAFT_965901 [Russula vinacea]